MEELHKSPIGWWIELEWFGSCGHRLTQMKSMEMLLGALQQTHKHTLIVIELG